MYKDVLMTVEKMKQIIIEEVPFTQLEKNKGIFEFHSDGEISLGISYEDIDDKENVYIYNVFCGEEYINICGEGTKENPLPDEIIKEMVQEWNVFVMLNENKERTYIELKSVTELVSQGLDAGIIQVEIDNIDMNELKVTIGDNWFWTPVSYIDNKTLLDSVPKEEMILQIVDTMLGIKEELDEDEFFYYQYYLEEQLFNYKIKDSVREWYIKSVPSDELGHKISPELTFEDVLEALKAEKNIYHTIGVTDSLVRENIFLELSKRLNVNYNDIYNLWTDGVSSNIKLWEDKTPKIIIEKPADLDYKIADAKGNLSSNKKDISSKGLSGDTLNNR